MVGVYAIVVGAGNRGTTFAQHDALTIAAVAEPDDLRRNAFCTTFKVLPKFAFACWKEALTSDVVNQLERQFHVNFRKNKDSDFVCTSSDTAGNKHELDTYNAHLIAIIATPDRVHVGPALQCAALFIDILLEKPMATTERDCELIATACEDRQIVCAVGHVLRYLPANLKIKQLIRSGRVGKVLSVRHLEPVGWWHFAHSFVRGNWKNENESTFLLMSKACHDIDLVLWWMSPSTRVMSQSVKLAVSGVTMTKGSGMGSAAGGDGYTAGCCVKVTSMGTLSYFTKDNQPAEAMGAVRCYDCPLVDTCLYSAKSIYTSLFDKGVRRWPLDVVIGDGEAATMDKLQKSLRDGPYGLCVYGACGNDVNDSQHVLLQFESGATATVSVIASTAAMCERHTQVYGSKGEIRCTSHKQVELVEFATGKSEIFDFDEHSKAIFESGDEESGSVVEMPSESHKKALCGHGSGDGRLMDSFLNAVRQRKSTLPTNHLASFASHRVIFRAEESRRTNTVVTI